MAFFGLTHLGYQNPIGDKLIVSSKGPSCFGGEQQTAALTVAEDASDNRDLPFRKSPSLSPEEQHGSPTPTEGGLGLQKPPLLSSDIHHGSHSKYQEMIMHFKTPQSPNELYLMPLTDNQQYGWLLSQRKEPWTHVQRFPLKKSEITIFVEEMSRSAPEFSLF